MTTENLIINDSSNRETIEYICKGFPHFSTVSSDTWNYNYESTEISKVSERAQNMFYMKYEQKTKGDVLDSEFYSFDF